MRLLIDEEYPKRLSELELHPEKALLLSRLASSGDIPNLLICGLSGAGKRTLVNSFLHEVHGEIIRKTKKDTFEFENSSGKEMLMQLILSRDHIEANPSTLGFYDRLGIQRLLEETGKTQQMYSTALRRFKTIVIHDADKLTRDAMHSLRRTMEKHANCIRFIFICQYPSRIIQALRSRTLSVAVPVPSAESVSKILAGIVEKRKLPAEFIKQIPKIVELSKRNLRKAILMLDAIKTCRLDEIESIGWENVARDIAEMIIKDQTPKTILSIRTKFYDLISHCISPTVIIKGVLSFLLQKTPGQKHRSIIEESAEYEFRAQRGGKEIFHLEAFAAKVMVALSI
eukprot:GHVN01084218.1.p1 GENE.GHVN01084218.1~~GHVN01084218.1.p1  ORF type:complete len:342 (+),score=20.71 GHVN01084218.1:2-1027(+)